jgi:hypothetical protein
MLDLISDLDPDVAIGIAATAAVAGLVRGFSTSVPAIGGWGRQAWRGGPPCQ